MEIEKNTKIAEAAAAFQKLSAANQDAIILMLKHLLSEREKYPAPSLTTEKTN